MEPVEVKQFSAKQLSKLRNGHPVRFAKGAGMTVSLSPDKKSKLEKAFQKNKAVTLSMSPDEISGSGLFAGGKINMKPIQSVLSGLKKVGTDMGKGYKKTVGLNPFELGYDAGYALGSELKKAPGIREAYGGKLKVPKGLVKFGSKLGEDVAKQAAKEIVKEGVKSAIAGEGVRRRRLGRKLGNSHIKSVTKELARAGKQILREVILPEGKKALTQAIRSGMSTASEPAFAEASFSDEIPMAEIYGNGLYAGARGGDLVSLCFANFNAGCAVTEPPPPSATAKQPAVAPAVDFTSSAIEMARGHVPFEIVHVFSHERVTDVESCISTGSRWTLLVPALMLGTSRLEAVRPHIGAMGLFPRLERDGIAASWCLLFSHHGWPAAGENKFVSFVI